MKTHFDSRLKMMGRDGVEGGAMAARASGAAGRASWVQGTAAGTPPRRAYPPPVYRREEDLYIIGEHAGMRLGRRA